MIDPKIIDDLTQRLAGMVPDSARTLQQDLEKNFRASLNSTFSRLDLVTREELEVQQAVLAKTRAKVEALETLVRELEAELQKRDADNP